MPRFNTAVRPALPNATNKAGGSAFKESPELELVGLLLTSFMQNTYYQTAGEAMTRLCSAIDALPNKRFAGQAAVYARTIFGMRSISHVAAAHIGATVRGERWTRPMFKALCARPDDITEMMALYHTTYGKYPHAMTAGLRAGLMQFDAYQVAKYKGLGHAVNLMDATNYLHPKGEQFSALMTGTLATPDTWETGLTEAGTAEDVSEAKAGVWASLIASGKIGQLALLRNLRNIIKQAPESVDAACALLANPDRIQKARIFPFQYFTAYEQVSDRRVTGAIQDAIDLAVSTVPKLGGRTVVVVDCSGSTAGKPITIASQFAAVLLKSNDCDLILFGSEAHTVRYNDRDSLVTLSKSIQTASLGGTNFRAALDAIQPGYERVIILSDNESWLHQAATVQVWRGKCKEWGKRPHLYSWDMAGTGTLQFPESQVYYLAGFSDKVFDVMGMLEQDREALLSKIRAVAL